MNYAWLFLVSFSVNILIWACIRSYVMDRWAEAFRTGLVMGRALDSTLLDRIMRDAGIDPATLP